MSYKCRICGVNAVDNPGDICELCAIGEDPYVQTAAVAGPFGSVPQSNAKQRISDDETQQAGSTYTPRRGTNRKILLDGGASLANKDPYGNDMTVSVPASPPAVHVYSAGQAPAALQQTAPAVSAQPVPVAVDFLPLATGIVKNLTVDKEKKSFLSKWFKSCFSGIPYASVDDVTMFQVFPDYTGSARTALGYASDQVAIYGKLTNGAICENNEVEVYGRRDSDNVIIAREVRNVATGTTVKPTKVMSPGAVRAITIVGVLAIVGSLLSFNFVGLIIAAVIILCVTNTRLLGKIVIAIFGGLFLYIRRMFRY